MLKLPIIVLCIKESPTDNRKRRSQVRAFCLILKIELDILKERKENIISGCVFPNIFDYQSLEIIDNKEGYDSNIL